MPWNVPDCHIGRHCSCAARWRGGQGYQGFGATTRGGNGGQVVAVTTLADAGAAYTDVHLRLPLLIGLAGAALIAAVLCAYNIWLVGIRLPIAAVVIVFAVSIVHTIVPSMIQSYRVKPDELRLESPYIAQNIAFTRYGFGLDGITSKPFPAKGTLTPAVLAANEATIQNIRWWDPRPLLDSYRQLQEIRLYYDFKDIDIDRYTLDGRYQQVMLSGRELNQSLADRGADVDQSALQVHPRLRRRDEPGKSVRRGRAAGLLRQGYSARGRRS